MSMGRQMTAIAYSRGWPIIRKKGKWIYKDTKKPCWKNDKRPCRRCGRSPTPEGHDACLGYIPGVAAACCGHGIQKGWVTKKEDLGISEIGIVKA